LATDFCYVHDSNFCAVIFGNLNQTVAARLRLAGPAVSLDYSGDAARATAARIALPPLAFLFQKDTQKTLAPWENVGPFGKKLGLAWPLREILEKNANCLGQY
jgi:hypothetical protein